MHRKINNCSHNKRGKKIAGTRLGLLSFLSGPGWTQKFCPELGQVFFLKLPPLPHSVEGQYCFQNMFKVELRESLAYPRMWGSKYMFTRYLALFEDIFRAKMFQLHSEKNNIPKTFISIFIFPGKPPFFCTYSTRCARVSLQWCTRQYILSLYWQTAVPLLLAWILISMNSKDSGNITLQLVGDFLVNLCWCFLALGVVIV